MAHGEGYKYGMGAVRRSREQQEGNGRKKKGEGKNGKKERKIKEREKEKKGRERRRKGKRCSDSRNLSDQEVKSVYSMGAALQEVGILPTLFSFYPLSYCFCLLLGPRCALFMACFLVLIGIWPCGLN